MPNISSLLGGKRLAEIRKALVAVAGLAAQLVALGVVPANLLPYVSGGLAFLAAVGVYVVPNADRLKAPAPDPAPVADAPGPVAPPAA